MRNDDDTPYRDASSPLTSLEIAAGMALEPLSPVRKRWIKSRGATARQALETEVLGWLNHGSVSVSFSGGRDSSLLIAVVADVARRHGHDLPTAITMRHPSKESDETAWQELVIGHTGIRDWRIVSLEGDMDVLGEDSVQFLVEHGLQHPANAYLHLPVVRACSGGTLLTGAGGDEFLGSSAPRLAQLFAGIQPVRPRDVATLALSRAPFAVQNRWRAKHIRLFAPWLRPHADREIRRRLASADSASPTRWDDQAMAYARSRSVALGRRALGLVGRPFGVQIESPLMSEGFADALAGELGPGGPRGRTEAMALLGSDVLPRSVIERQTKAIFSAGVWGERFRAFAETWSPDELSPELGAYVDARRLAQVWRGARPSSMSTMLLQRAWLDRRTRGESRS